MKETPWQRKREDVVSASSNAYEVLRDRGFVEQVTDSGGVKEYLEGTATAYIGFDPTADSLHVGSLVPILALVHLQRRGHRPVALVGGGTGLVGDPSGKTEMRRLLDLESIRRNVESLGKQLSRFLDFSEGRALLLNNADWLVDLRYIEFLRDVGRHFSVNRMLAAESYRMRLETGLSFIEFNYMLLQAYDFYYLSRNHATYLQMGGNDQWGNIVAGIDLIRRKAGETAYGITFPLITTATGEKMGKTAAGAVWLSPRRTSPYDFYQYWVNTDDRDVARFLRLYTLLPLEEIEAVASLEGRDLNACKSILAYEVTALTHGSEAAAEAHEAAARLFGRRELDEALLPSSGVSRRSGGKGDGVPTTVVDAGRLGAGIPAYELFAETGLCSSRGAARRLFQQGGAYINGERVKDFDFVVNLDCLTDDGIALKAGKKKNHRILVRD